MNFRGNVVDHYPQGTRLGPDASGLVHEVIEATYDETTNRTKVRTRKLEVEGRRLRFTGGTE